MGKILLAGTTGYLGTFIYRELLNRGTEMCIIARHLDKIDPQPGEENRVTIFQAEVTRPETIVNCCVGIDTVISTVGITKPQKGLTYQDVDYQANLNLLNEAVKSGVRKFIYISVFKGEQLQNVAICRAKEKFVTALKASGLDYCIIRPTGYFSDMSEFYKLAVKGRVYLFNSGRSLINPISGRDLASLCANAINDAQVEVNAGGPQTFTFNQIAQTAFEVLGKKPKITYIPNWLAKVGLLIASLSLPQATFGPLEFFMTVMTNDMNAAEYGRDTLKSYFEKIKADSQA